VKGVTRAKIRGYSLSAEEPVGYSFARESEERNGKIRILLFKG